MILLDINSTVLAHASIDFRLLVIISLLVVVLRGRYTRRRLITVSVWYPYCRIVLRLAEYNVLRNAVAADLSIRSIFKKLQDVFFMPEYQRKSYLEKNNLFPVWQYHVTLTINLVDGDGSDLLDRKIHFWVDPHSRWGHLVLSLLRWIELCAR